MVVYDTADHLFRNDEIFRFVFGDRRATRDRSVEKLIDQILISPEKKQARGTHLTKVVIRLDRHRRRSLTSVRFSSRLDPVKSRSAMPSLSIFSRSM